MALLILGLVLFLGIHVVPMMPALRARMVAAMGEKPYKGFFALTAAAGLVLIVAGWPGAPDQVRVFPPLPAARSAAPAVVALAFVLFAAANMRTHLRAKLRHPMLIGLLLWSGVHLLANGDLAGTVLFASFAVYSIAAIVSAEARGAVKPVIPTAKHDAIAVVSGLILAYVVMRFHPQIFGTGPVV